MFSEEIRLVRNQLLMLLHVKVDRSNNFVTVQKWNKYDLLILGAFNIPVTGLLYII